jgi:hypothetical protein
MALLFAAALLLLAGCPQEPEEYSGDVSLSSLSINDNAARNLPQIPTPRDEWEREDFKISTMDIAHVVFPVAAFDGDGEIKGARILAGVASGTEIWYIKPVGGLKPADDAAWTQGNTFDLKPDNSVYLQVTAADKKTQVYYRIQIHMLSSAASIKSLIIGGKNTGISDIDGAAALADVNLGAVNLSFGTENLNAPIEVTKTSNGAEVQFLRVEAGAALDPAAFSALAVYNLDDGDTVYVKVTPSDGGDPSYYGAEVTSRRVSAVNIGGINNPVIAVPGSPSADAAQEIEVLLTTSDMTTELSVVKARGVTIEYAYPGSAAYAALPEDAAITYVDNSILYIKAKADGFKDVYYKFAVAAKNDNRNVESVNIGGNTSAVVGTGAAAINVGTTAGLRGSVTLSTSQAAAGKTVAVTFEDAEAVVTGYAILASATTPTAASYGTGFAASPADNQLSAAITSGQHLHLRVEAANGDIWYHRIVVTVQSDNADLTAITAAAISATLGTPQSAPWSGTANQGTVGIDPAVLAAGSIAVTSTNAASAVRTYAVTANAATLPAADAFTGTNNAGTLATLAAGNYIWVRSVSQDGEVTKYYKILVESKQNVATLASADINSTPVGALPTPAATWTAAGATVHPLGAVAPASVVLAAVVTVGSNATVRYGYSTSATEPVWGSSATFTAPVSGAYIGVEVTAENGSTKQYYKWRLSFGSTSAALAANPAVYIAGVPTVSTGNPGTVYNSTGMSNGAIYLNSTQAAIGKSVVVYVASSDISAVEMSTNNAGTNDTTAPTFGVAFTRDGTDPTKWAGAITTTALTTTNRRFYIRVTAEDAVTQAVYRFQVTYQANYSVLNALTFNGATVAAANRGTPAGSWNATDLVPGQFIMNSIPDPLPVTFTWQTGGTNATSYAVTSVFPPASEPVWTTGTTPLSLTTVASGDYIWIRGVNNTNTNNSYRNIYVIKVGPPPFTVSFGAKAVEWADLGTSSTGAALTFSGTPTAIGKVWLTAAEATNVNVTGTPANPSDTVKLVKYTIPNATGTTVAIQTAAIGTATNTLPGATFTGKDVLQIGYTPNGSSATTYYVVYIRRTVDIPFVELATIDPAVATVEAAWATAPVIKMDRTYMPDSGNWSLVTDFDAANPPTVKLLWSTDGLYYLAEIADATESLGADHQCDNLEFFINEAYTGANTGNWNGSGGQYRVGRNSTISGDSTTRVTRIVTNTETGYTIKARIAWATAAATVAGWADGKMLGIEAQLAYSRSSGTRDACVMWNNFLAASYQQMANAGIAYLRK